MTGRRQNARSAALIILLSCLASLLLYLVCERLILNRCLNRIPLRIAVTGTRGKSSVARIIASILTEDGRRVLAKTTGSQAMLLLPDGRRLELRRRGTPTILEQKKAIREARRLHADCLVAEIMSIHPENHRVESQQILKPGIVAITNVRLDHTEAMGGTAENIASVLSLGIPPDSVVFVPEQALQRPFSEAADLTGSMLLTVTPGIASHLLQTAPDLARREFPENLDLAYALARHLKISDDTILSGILKAQFDIGKLRVWRARYKDRDACFYLANAFAANDPSSTLQILSKLLESLPGSTDRVTGILNLRADRLPRTLQWIAALRAGALSRFSRLYVVGDGCGMVRRQLPDVVILREGRPESLMAQITSELPEEALVFGFGNIKGLGSLLAAHWSRIGDDYGI